MKKFLLIIFLSLVLVSCDFGAEQTTKEPIVIDTDNYIEITNVEELKNIEMNKSYILMNDLDISGEEWEPLGTYSSPYLGNFDGNGMTISNLTITMDHQHNGLFACVDGNISNLKIIDFSINYETELITFSGGLAGTVSGKVQNVEVDGTISINNTKSNVYAGLLVGMAEKMYANEEFANFLPSIIVGNTANGTIDVNAEKIVFVGGLIGKSLNSRIYENFVSSTLNAISLNNKSHVGGLIGHNYSGITSGYEEERILLNISIYSNISNSIITNEAQGYASHTGGLIGYNNYGYVFNNFSKTDITASGLENCYGYLVGEDWNSENKDSIAIGNVETLNQTDMENYFNNIYGRSYGDYSLTNSYWYSETNQDTEDSNFTLKSNLTSQAWYTENLEWDIDFINQIIGLIE
ncbi:MAG: hypothetical protein WC152_04850 [Candidatus Izemoplasmatales bacterium]